MNKLRSEIITLYKSKILDIYSHAVESVKPDKLISNSVQIKNDLLSICQRSSHEKPINIDLKKTNVHVVSFGKSAISLAKSIGNIVVNSTSLNSFRNGFIIAPTNLKDKFYSQYELNKNNIFKNLDLTCRFGAANNLPDHNSLSATLELLKFVKTITKLDASCGKESAFLILIGGGGSACLSLPRFVDLEKKLEIIKYLQQNGADIVELNKVRRFLSQVKGGKLANQILNQGDGVKIISLIVSDVIGNPVEHIASGPTFIHDNNADNNGWLISEEKKRNDFIEILSKYKYNKLDEIVDQISEDNIELRTLPPNTKDRVKNIIIGDNLIAIEAAKHRAQELGFNVVEMGNCLDGYTDDLVLNIINRAKSTDLTTTRTSIYIGGGEPTIKKQPEDSWGLGGRAQEMALDYLIKVCDNKCQIDSMNDYLDIFLAGTTDGQDGPTDVAACMVSHAHLVDSGNESDCDRLRIQAMIAKRSHDSFHFWNKIQPNWLIKTGPTETNVMDIYMLLISNDR